MVNNRNINNKKTQDFEDDPLFDIVGAGEGEEIDGSEEHDKYLYGSIDQV